MGRIDYNQKRVYRVIDTWALLENEFPDWRLTIIGDGIERKNIEQKVIDLKLKHVSFEGFQNLSLIISVLHYFYLLLNMKDFL